MAVDSGEGHLGLELVERYQLTEVLARGALCTVYRGTDVMLKRPVAVKAVPPELCETYRASLAATTTLAHPATIALYDAIQQGEWLFLVQEYVRAQAITSYLTQGVPSARAVDIGLQLARALDHAHRRNMLHGDLTPSAVLVDRHAVVRVNNFGLPPDAEYFARMRTLVKLEDDSYSTAVLPETKLDSANEAWARTAEDPGSPQARDVRAIGYILWQLLSEPRGGESSGRRVLRPDVSEPVADVLHRCCALPGEEPIADAITLVGEFERLEAALASERPALSTMTPPALRAARTAIEEAAAWALEETLENEQMFAVSAPGKQGKTGAPVPSKPISASAPTIPVAPSPYALPSSLAAGASGTTDPGSDLAATRPSLDADGVVRPGLRLPARPYDDDLPPPLPQTYPARQNAIWPGGAAVRRETGRPQSGGLSLGAVLVLGAVLFVIFFFIGYLLPITLGAGR